MGKPAPSLAKDNPTLNSTYPYRLRRLTCVVAALVLSLLTACAPGLPTVVVDEQHFTAFKQGEFEQGYQFKPADGFHVDATGYPFLIPAESPFIPGPNMIQVTTGDGQVFSHPWDMQATRYELTPANLINLETGAAFPGLVAGQGYLLGIGYLESSGRFNVLWAAVINVDGT